LLSGPVEVLALEPAPDAEADLLFRALSYNRTFQARRRATVVVAVVTRPGGVTAECMASRAALAEQAARLSPPARVSYLAYVDSQSFEEAVTHVGPAVVYVCAGVGGQPVAVIARRHHINTVAATQEQLEAGLSTGFKAQSGKLGLVVNLAALRAEGQDVDSALLRFVTVVR
jgi:hypothetical protein